MKWGIDKKMAMERAGRFNLSVISGKKDIDASKLMWDSDSGIEYQIFQTFLLLALRWFCCGCVTCRKLGNAILASNCKEFRFWRKNLGNFSSFLFLFLSDRLTQARNRRRKEEVDSGTTFRWTTSENNLLKIDFNLKKSVYILDRKYS